jgi:SpoVK/Ycf46/Vps4 family AAA+-type ATPase
MKLTKLAKQIQVSTKSMKQFIQDFELGRYGINAEKDSVAAHFEAFATDNIDFLKKYEEDLGEKKTADQLAEKISQPKELVEKAAKDKNFPILENGFFKTSVSSYGIDHYLGGDYRFVYRYFDQKTPLEHIDFVGYRDLYFYISEMLEPFLDPKQVKDWGISKPAGIIVYGAPGSGKIFWSEKIAKIIGYRFEEVKRNFLGTSFVDGGKTDFNDYLNTVLKEDKVLLFLDDFDQIMMERKPESDVEACNLEIQSSVMHQIGRFTKENVLMVGSAISLADIDNEMLAPGRFDVFIPVFPPNANERAELIRHAMTKNLEADSLLMKILKNNKADQIPFWKPIAERMKAFSNTMLIDFTQSLRKKIKNLYQKNHNESLKIDAELLESALRDSAAKLTREYLDQMTKFLIDVATYNFDDFKGRIENLKKELESYKSVEQPRKSIGFSHNEGDVG